MTTTTLKLSEKLKTRIALLAKTTGRSTHRLMLDALERGVTREKQMQAFVREARAADVAITGSANIYRAEDVHSWLEYLAARHDSPRPKPWRKKSIRLHRRYS